MESTKLYRLIEQFPFSVRAALHRLSDTTLAGLTEIRLRADGISTVTMEGENLYLTDVGLSHEPTRCVRTSERDLDDFLYRFCGGSVYAYEESMKRGFLTHDGIRVGLCGRTVSNGGEMCGFSHISGLCLRIPHHVSGAAEMALALYAEKGLSAGGLLVIAPPGVGKTTFLRDLAIGLSRDIRTKSRNRGRFYRVCLLDERDELYLPDVFSGCAADVIGGLSKAKALECAARVLSPEVVICDEIGSERDAAAIFEAHLGGIVFAASLHGRCTDDALKKPSVMTLCRAGIFRTLCVLERKGHKVESTLYTLDGETAVPLC